MSHGVPSLIAPIGSRLHDLYLETRKLADQLASSSQVSALPVARKASSLYLIDGNGSDIDRLLSLETTKQECERDSKDTNKVEANADTLDWFQEQVQYHFEANNNIISGSLEHPGFKPQMLESTFLQSFLHKSDHSVTKPSTVWLEINTSAKCDQVSISENSMASACRGDFYDDDVISRNCYNIDSVSCITSTCLTSQNSGLCKEGASFNSLMSESLLNITPPMSMSTMDRCTDGILMSNSSNKTPDHNPQKPNMDQLRLIEAHMVEYVSSSILCLL